MVFAWAALRSGRADRQGSLPFPASSIGWSRSSPAIFRIRSQLLHELKVCLGITDRFFLCIRYTSYPVVRSPRQICRLSRFGEEAVGPMLDGLVIVAAIICPTPGAMDPALRKVF